MATLTLTFNILRAVPQVILQILTGKLLRRRFTGFAATA
jgi:hypothetical protein